MIITPKKLLTWINNSKNFSAIDIRPTQLQKDYSILGLKCITSENNLFPKIKSPTVLICQYGLVTEGLIIEKNLSNTFSLLGGSEAWNEFYKSNLDLSRWSRQIILPDFGLKGQKKIMHSCVAVIGMGGLGCPSSQSLVSSGLGKLVIVDGDKIELSNLHRQPLYCLDDIGKAKVEVAKARLNYLNKDTHIKSFNCFIDEINGLKLLKGVDIILDATDNFESRKKINKISKKLKIPVVYGGLYKFEGHVSVFNFKNGPSYDDIFPNSNNEDDDCDTLGTLGMLSGIIGNIQAMEAIKILVGIKDNLSGKLLIYDSINHETNIIELQ